MKYLLDVNALIAYGYRKHDFHGRVGVWIRSRMSDRFLTCSITEWDSFEYWEIFVPMA